MTPWAPSHFSDDPMDVTRIDLDALAGQWSTEVIQIRGGFRAVMAAEPCVIRFPTQEGDLTAFRFELGDIGCMVVDHAQKMERHIVNGTIFDFLIGAIA